MSGKSGCLLRWLKAASFAVLALAVVHAGLTIWAGRKLERQLEALRKAGEPVALKDLAGTDIPPGRNAFTYLSEAGRLMKAMPDSEKLQRAYEAALGSDRPDWAAVEAALLRFAPAERLLRRGLECPRARMVDWAGADVFHLVLPDLSTMRQLARLLEARSALAAHRGDTASAVRHALDIFRLSECLRDEPTMIAQLVRFAIISLGTRRMDVALASPGSLTVGQVQEASDTLGRVDLSGSMATALRGERVLLLTALSQALRGPMAVSLLANGDAGPPAEPGPLRRAIDRLLGYALAPVICLDQISYIHLTERQLEALQAPAPRRAKLLLEIDRDRDSVPRHAIFTRMLAPVFGRAVVPSLTAEANLEACRAMLALAAFRAETGGYPAALKEACVRSGLPVPRDPFSGGELIYRREGNSYLLYSIGEDWRDDGGTPAGKRAGDGSGTGDLVWGGGRSAAGKSGPS